MRRRVLYAGMLTVFWVMLWDRVSLPNIIGGLAVATLLLVAFPLPPAATGDELRLHPVAFAALAVAVLKEVTVSTWAVARQTVSRSAGLHTGVVACVMRTDSPKLLSTVANIIALSPGTMVVDATDDPPTLYVHVLTLSDVEDVRRTVAKLEQRVISALAADAARWT